MSDDESIREHLEFIAEGRGRFSQDHHTHAANCIEDMKEHAVAALTQLDELERDHEAMKATVADELDAHAGELHLTSNDMEIKAEQMIACLRTQALCLEGQASHIRAILGGRESSDE